MTSPIALPIDPFLTKVTQALRADRDVVLVAEPGAGKTTRVPPAIIESGLLGGQKLVMLQPRRVAARAAASRIADEHAWTVGEEVGYQVRFERILKSSTPLRILTEGVLVRQLVSDPALEGVGCVVLDEFHERSLDADLALAMLREAKAALREDLRLVVMSATLDADEVAAFLGTSVEILHVPGRLFPVEVSYAGDSPEPVEVKVKKALADAIHELSTEIGDILVFLPGVREIERTMAEIAPLAKRAGYDVIPLHGQLDKNEQDAAVSFDENQRPRVICATNVAETSLTLPGVRLVIDSGLVRQAGYDATRGVATLTTERISRASAEQRAGRAGRVAAGRCVRLWSKMTQNALPAFDVPEVRRADLCEVSLAIRAWGGEPTRFGWFESPDERLLRSADELLALLGAVEENRLTPLGKTLQTLPLHPRPARLLTAAPRHLASEAVTVAALLGEGADVPGRRTASVRELLAAFEARRLDPATDHAVRRAREALSRWGGSGEGGEPSVDSLEELLLMAYPDRVGRRRSADVATLATGGGARLPEPSALRGDWFLALDPRRGNFAKAQQADVRLLAEIEVEWLENLLPQHVVRESVAEWDEARQAVVAVRRRRYLDLVIDEQRGGKVEPAEVRRLLVEHLGADAASLLQSDEATGALARRVAMLERYLPKHLSPGNETNFEENEVLADAIAAAVSAGEPSRAGVVKRMADAFRARLWASPWHRLLEEHAPETIEVPTGSRIRLDWMVADVDGARGPVLAVRLQEMFGLAETPRVCGGTVPVTLHLLAPNLRPVQVTDDLASFWKNTYPQVRKDLRARYAKHSWPDDPLAAEPMRGAKRRRP